MKSGIWNYNAANSDFRSLRLGATLYNGAEPIQIIIYVGCIGPEDVGVVQLSR